MMASCGIDSGLLFKQPNKENNPVWWEKNYDSASDEPGPVNSGKSLIFLIASSQLEWHETTRHSVERVDWICVMRSTKQMIDRLIQHVPATHAQHSPELICAIWLSPRRCLQLHFSPFTIYRSWSLSCPIYGRPYLLGKWLILRMIFGTTFKNTDHRRRSQWR